MGILRDTILKSKLRIWKYSTKANLWKNKNMTSCKRLLFHVGEVFLLYRLLTMTFQESTRPSFYFSQSNLAFKGMVHSRRVLLCWAGPVKVPLAFGCPIPSLKKSPLGWLLATIAPKGSGKPQSGTQHSLCPHISLRLLGDALPRHGLVSPSWDRGAL